MDKISGFSDDELLVKILSFLPTKVAVSTSILSKQWRFLWMLVPKLDYDDTTVYNALLKGDSRKLSSLSKIQRIRCFIYKNLPLHRAPVIESFRLNFQSASFQPEDITLWVALAVSQSLRDLSVGLFHSKGEPNASLPRRLLTCKSLVTLKLQGRVLVDIPHVVRLPSLKTLHLRNLTYADEVSLQRLLSSSSVLEDLIVKRLKGDNVRKLAITVPSLLSLTFEVALGCTSDGYVIDTPSLKYLKARGFGNDSSFLIVNMPKLVEAYISVLGFRNIKKLLESVTSVKRLSLHVLANEAEAVYGDDIDVVFNELAHLEFSIYDTYWSKLLFWLLKISPKLQDLEFKEHFVRDGMDTLVCWKQLISVPQCLLSSLQTFKLSGPHVSVEGRDLATYILRNSLRLNTAASLIGSEIDPQKKLEILTEMGFRSRGSTTCNLVFD